MKTTEEKNIERIANKCLASLESRIEILEKEFSKKIVSQKTVVRKIELIISSLERIHKETEESNTKWVVGSQVLALTALLRVFKEID